MQEFNLYPNNILANTNDILCLIIANVIRISLVLTEEANFLSNVLHALLHNLRNVFSILSRSQHVNIL